MNWRRLFNPTAEAKPAFRGAAETAAAGDKGAKGTFITLQSLTTFPVATFVITLFCKIVEALHPPWAGILWVPLTISVIVGAFIFYAGISEPGLNLSGRDKGAAVFVALINTGYLFAVSTGIVTDVAKILK